MPKKQAAPMPGPTLHDFPNGEVMRDALQAVFGFVEDAKLLQVLTELERTGHGVWHHSDLDGG